MRLLPTQQCLAGMRLAKAIYSEEGNILLRAHVELTQSLLNRLYQLGFDFLYIEDERTDDIAMQEPIQEETKRFALTAINNAFRKISEDIGTMTTADVSAVTKAVTQVVKLIMDEIHDDSRGTIMLMNMNVLKPYEWERFYCNNALNVTVYSTMLGRILGYGEDLVYAMALGALLHDIGNSRLPSRLFRKNDKLTPFEYKEVQRHTEIGFELLKSDVHIPPLAALAVLQHHERIDGSGYPYGLKDEEIHDLAKWIGLLDTYDAMTNPRSYRSARLPHEALEVLYASTGTLFDKSRIEMFRNVTAIYPPGIPVTLSTGEQGIVSSINGSCKQRPVVRVLQNARGEHLRQPFEIDLSEKLSVMIDRIAGQPQSVPTLMRHKGIPATLVE